MSDPANPHLIAKRKRCEMAMALLGTHHRSRLWVSVDEQHRAPHTVWKIRKNGVGHPPIDLGVGQRCEDVEVLRDPPECQIGVLTL